jgi:hypothetical protein
MMTFTGPRLRKPLLSGVAERGVPDGEPALQQGTGHHKLIVASMVSRRAAPMVAELARSPLESNPPREPAAAIVMSQCGPAGSA